jgi:phosphoribosyl-ATP pyrophosphohydrolase
VTTALDQPTGDSLPAALERLAKTVADRRGADASRSYTAQLLADPKRAARKFGEEALEVVMAALCEGPEALAAESADLLYHWIVLMQANGVPLEQVAERLRDREGRSGLEEKEARSGL